MSGENWVVIKIGGSILDNEKAVLPLVKQISELIALGKKPIIVHGGGPFINRMLAEKGVQPVFVDGLRVTDGQTLSLAIEALDYVNSFIAAALVKSKIKAVRLNSRSQLLSCKKAAPAGPDKLDLGHVGEIESVDTALIERFAGCVPVICPIGSDVKHRYYNVNGDHAAMAVAAALEAEVLVFLSDVPGVLTDKTNPETRIPSMAAARADELIESGIISGGMIPKINNCLAAIKNGVKQASIADGRSPQGLLDSIFQPVLSGTAITSA